MNKILYVVPDKRSKSALIKESSGVRYLCPANTVMTGRWHSGDENGNTQYEYATLKIVDSDNVVQQGVIQVLDVQWSDEIKESSGTTFVAPTDRVIVGRYHSGDENGPTQYATAIIKVDGQQVKTFDLQSHSPFKESSGTWFVTDAQRVIVGRNHDGDENGKTFYITARLSANMPEKEPAPKGTLIIPNVRSYSAEYKESNHKFECPKNTVMTGRIHTGDENGTTKYQYATLKAIDWQGNRLPGEVTIEDYQWSKSIPENQGTGFDAPVNRVVVGREHYGDETRPTIYRTAVVKYNGHPTYISNYNISEIQRENDSDFQSGPREVVTGRQHYGDENGFTFFQYGMIYAHPHLEPNPLPFDLVVSLHANEENFPMSAFDFAVVSRLRRHQELGEDMGFDKTLDKYVVSNSQAPNFYNIPIGKINASRSYETHKLLFNVRPHDQCNVNRPDSAEGSFLETFANLHGDSEPTGKVPAYVNKLEYKQEDGSLLTYVDFWLFFGFNGTANFPHQGDWEHVMIELVNNKLNGAWFSQHKSLKFFPASQLNVENINGKPLITVYCEQNAHAMYPDYNKEIRGQEEENAEDRNPESRQNTTRVGYRWKVTDFMEDLNTRPWKLFAGAWGKVTIFVDSTGPLGAWYKRYNFWHDTELDLSSIISGNEILIVPDKYIISYGQAESSGFAFEAPAGMVMVGRKHSGDENGETRCLYATLKAIDANGASLAGTIAVVNQQWTEWIKERDSKFLAPAGFVILGRQHKGDENGETRYKIGKITYNGRATNVIDASDRIPYQIYMEHMKVFFQTNKYCLFTGRVHTGDEESKTHNFQSFVKVI